MLFTWEPGPSRGRQDRGAAPCSQPTSIRRHREELPWPRARPTAATNTTGLTSDPPRLRAALRRHRPHRPTASREPLSSPPGYGPAAQEPQPYAQQYGYGHQPGYGYPPGPQTEGLATAALVIAIAGFFTCPPVGAVVALVLANNASQRIEASGGRLSGLEQARAARIIAIIELALTAIVVLVGAIGMAIALRGTHFLLHKGAGGPFTPIDYPGAAFTVPFDLNDRDQVVGSYLDAAGKPQGFLLDDGVYTVIDTSAYPSAQLLGINDRGEIVGGYLDPDGKVRGLLRDTKGSFTTFFAPQAVSQTGALDINDRRQIVGIYR